MGREIHEVKRNKKVQMFSIWRQDVTSGFYCIDTDTEKQKNTTE